MNYFLIIFSQIFIICFAMLCLLQQHETSRGLVEVFYWLFKRIPYRRYYQWLGSYRTL